MRKDTKEIRIGNITIGNKNKIAIQRMTNTKTKDVTKTITQINELVKAGCDIVRLAITDEEDAYAISKIKQKITCPIVADIQSSPKLAIRAIKQGIDKIRINPGNITNPMDIKEIVEACKEYHIPMRLGINSGSLPKSITGKTTIITSEILVEYLLSIVSLIESWDYNDLVLSIKTTSIDSAIKVNQLLSSKTSYPLHIGLTEAGTQKAGTIRSSYVLGTLLNEGIGDTIRVSLTGNPINEIEPAKEILSMFHLYNKPTLISCPTCGRTNYEMEKIIEQIEPFLNQLSSPITVAIMGCAVNGPGEARHCDIGIAGGLNEALLFKKGKVIRKIPQDKIVEELKLEINQMINIK